MPIAMPGMKPIMGGGDVLPSAPATPAPSVEDNLYTVMYGYVTLSAGGNIPVIGFRLILQHNGVPAIALRIIPVRGEQGNPDDGGKSGKRARPIDLKECVDLFLALKTMISNPTERFASFTFLAKSAGGDVQELNLTDWIMTGVGYPKISASGALEMSLDLMHPAKKLNDSVVQLLGLKTDGLDASLVAGGSVLELATSALSLIYANSVNRVDYVTLVPSTGENSADAGAGFSIAQDRFKEAKDALPHHFQWEDLTGTAYRLPCSPAPDYENYFGYAMLEQAKTVASRTLWDWFAHGVVSDWFLSIMPTFYRDWLRVGAFAPWAPAMVTIQEYDILEFANPPDQPLLMAGTVMSLLVPNVAGDGACRTDGGLNDWSSQCVMHTEPTLYGSIMSVPPPQWWSCAHMQHSNSVSENSSIKPDDLSGLTISLDSAVENPADGKPAPALIASAMAIWAAVACKESFIEHYQRDLRVGLVCRLMIQNATAAPGIMAGYILPGCVYEVQTEGLLPESEKKPMLRFFCTEVTHVVDCDAKVAYTALGGGYVREAPGGAAVTDLIAIPHGEVHNLLYGGY